MLDSIKLTIINLLQTINGFFTEAMNGNELIGGAITASILGTLSYLLVGVIKKLLRIIKNKLFFSHNIVFSRGTYGVEYENQESISAIGTLLERKIYSQNKNRIHSAQILVVNRKLQLSLPDIRNFMFLGGVPVLVRKTRNSGGGKSTDQVTLEEITINIISLRRHREHILSSIKQLNPSTVIPGIYNLTNTTSRVRDLSLTPNYVLDKDIKDKIDNFIEDYLKCRANDSSHKATLLLYGPPGTGKSTISEYIATKLNSSLFCIGPQNQGFSLMQPADIAGYMQQCRKSIGDEEIPILLADDIDVLWPGVDGRANFKKKEDIKTNVDRLTNELDSKILVNLLRSLQSPVSYTGGIFVITTNALDKLDRAIYRPGRVQLMLEINNLQPDTIRELYKANYGVSLDSEKQINSMRACDVSDLLSSLSADEFVAAVTNESYTPKDIAFVNEK